MMKKGIFKKLVAAFAIVTVLAYQVLPITKVFAEGAYTVTFTFEDNWKGETLGDNRISVYKEGQDGNNITELRTDMDDNNSVVGSSSCSQDGSSCTITVESGVPTYLATGANVKNFNFSTQIAGNMNLTIGDGQSGQFEPSYLVNFEGASWTIDNITVTATVAGKDIASEPQEIGPDESIVLTNWDSSKMQVRISASPSGFNTLLYPTNEGIVKLSDLPENTNIPNEDLTFIVEPLSGGSQLGESYTVDFGTASWTIGETTVTASIEGVTLTNGPVEVDATDRIALTNFDSSKMVIKLVGENNFSATLSCSGEGTTGVTDLEDPNTVLPPDNLTFVIEAKEQQQPQQPVGGDEDIEFDVAFTNTHIIMEINGILVVDDSDGLKNAYQGTKENAGTTNSNETNIIKVMNSFGEFPIASVTINGTAYTENSSNVTIDLVDGGWIIEVPGAVKYTITGTGDTTAVVPRTIIWANIDADTSAENYAPDMLLEHGSAGIIAVYDENDQLVDPSEYLGEHSDEYGIDEKGLGWAKVEPGSRVVFEFVPEYGYQLTSVEANGSPLEPQDTINQYEFTMPDTNIHFAATFKPTSDVVKTESDKVRSGKIDVGTNLDGGSAELTIKDIELSPDKIKNFEGAADGYEVSNYLDIDLYNIFYKGKDDADDVWSNKIDELEKEVVITIKLAKGVNGNDIVIVHNIHDGDEYEIIPTVYDAKTNTITFKTKSFSNYAIGSRTVATANPKTGDNFFLYLALLSMSSIGLVLSKKAKNNN